MKPKISVIVPCYNSEEYIRTCMSSLEGQTIGMENLEIIFVDDASTDQTLQVLLGFEQHYSEQVKVIPLEKNRKQGGARNIGITYASGEYLAFLDSDDWIELNAYKVLYELAKSNQLDIIQFNHYNVWPKTNEKVEMKNCLMEGILDVSEPEVKRLFLVGKVFTYGCWNKLYRTTFVREQHAKFAEQVIYEEPLFVYPLLLGAKRVCSSSSFLYNCRQHTKSTMHTVESGRIMEHASVQRKVAEQVCCNLEYMKEYGQEIEYYFLWTYLLETVYMLKNAGLGLKLKDKQEMYNTLNLMFPNWKQNFYLNASGLEETKLILLEMEATQSEKWLKEIGNHMVPKG